MLQSVPYIWLKRISRHCGKPYNLKLHLCDDLRFFQHYDFNLCLYLKATTELLFLSTFGHPWVKVGPNTWVFEKRISVKNWNAAIPAIPWKTKHLALMWVKIRKKQLFIYILYIHTVSSLLCIYVSIRKLYLPGIPTPPNRWPWLCSSHFWYATSFGAPKDLPRRALSNIEA